MENTSPSPWPKTARHGVPGDLFRNWRTGRRCADSADRCSYQSSLCWTPDNRALVLVDSCSGAANLWAFPVFRRGEPKQLTFYDSGSIEGCQLSLDGKWLAVVRYSRVSDAVLFREGSRSGNSQFSRTLSRTRPSPKANDVLSCAQRQSRPTPDKSCRTRTSLLRLALIRRFRVRMALCRVVRVIRPRERMARSARLVAQIFSSS